MLNFKNKLAKRILAFVLSGTMVFSGMATSGVTAFAAESSDKAVYYEETDNIADEAEEAEIVEGAETLREGEPSDTDDSDNSDDSDDSGNTDNPDPDNPTPSEDIKPSETNPNTPDPSEVTKPSEPETTEVTKPSEPASSEVTKPSEPESSEGNPSTENESTEQTSGDQGGDEDEDLVTMQRNKTYTLDVSALTIEDGVALSSDKVFKLLAGENTEIATLETGKETQFRRLNVSDGQLATEPLGNRIVMGGEVSAESNAILFKTPASADVVVYWSSKAADSKLEILDSTGEPVAETITSAIANGTYISTMTLEDAGAYYLGGDNYIYKVEVTTPAATKKHLTTLVSGNTTTWDLKNDKTNFPAMTEGPDENNKRPTAIEGCGEEYYGLYVDANRNGSSNGKWAMQSNRAQVNTYTIVWIPLEGRSKVTASWTDDTAKYTMDGKASTGATDSFICVGENGYAVMNVTAGRYLESIKVEKIKTAAVSGKVTGISDECEITFTEKTENSAKSVITVPVEKVGDEFTYSADLYVGCTYTVSLSDKTVKITDGNEVTVAETDTTKTLDVTAETMSTIEVSGDIVLPEGAASEDFDGLKITFKSSGHTAEAEIVDDSYTVTLESGFEYTVTADAARINDYMWTPEKLTAGENDMTEQTITFAPQTTSKVTVNVTSFDEGFDISRSEITFTNKADDYTYTATGVENIELRDGTYAVSMDIAYPYALDTADHKFADLRVNGASTYALNLVERMEWDFTGADPMLKPQTIQGSDTVVSYHGLNVDSSRDKTVTLSDGKTYTTYGKFDVQASQVQVNTTTEVMIPVSGKGTITITTSQANDRNHYTMDGVFATGDPQTWNYDNPATGYVTLQVTKTKESNGATATGSIYLKNIKIVRTEEGTKPPTPPVGEKHTIWFVGDSTVCTYNTYNADGSVKSYKDNYYYPRYGYGEQFKYYVDSSYTINNLAISGCSSKDYLTKSEYNTLKSGMKPGDILIIGFGHNDSKMDETAPARYTNPNGDWQTEGSFAKSLYDNYVKVAQDAGATPILCTPIVRRSDSDNYTGSSVHNPSGSNGYEGGDYRLAIENLGKAKDIPVVDLTTLTKERWLQLTAAQSIYLHAWKGTTNDSSTRDNTHLNVYGAKVVAHILATEISKLDSTKVALADHIANLDDVPTKVNDLVANPKYDQGYVSNYVSPTDTSKIWKNYGIFNGSVFGSVSNEISAENYTFGTDKGGMRIASGGSGTKISDTEDARAMYYYAIPSDTTFKLTAKATVNAIGDDNTTAFGLMARDDMIVDTKYNPSIWLDGEGNTTDYVVAGTFAKDSTNCFRRKSGVLVKGDAITAVKAGESYDLSLEFNGDGYACIFGTNTSASEGYDYALSTIDSKQYIGMFVSGNADITFSNIKLIVDGKEVSIGVEEGGDTGETGDTNETDEIGEVEPSGDTIEDKKPAYDGSNIIYINSDKIKVEAANLVANGKTQYKVTVTYAYTYTYKNADGTEVTEVKQQELTQGIHYNVNFVTGFEGKDPGPQKIMVTGTNAQTDLGTFRGSKTVEYKLLDKKNKEETAKEFDITKVKGLGLDKNQIKNLTYTGGYITPDVVGLENIDPANYKLVYKNNVNAGKASVTVFGQGQYYGSKEFKFTIKPANITKAEMVLDSTNLKIEKGAKDYAATAEKPGKADALTYKGKEIIFNSLSVKLKLGENDFVTLNPRTDYTITYKKNAQAGAALATIKAANNFTGAIKVNYTIVTDDTKVNADELAKLTDVSAEYTAKGPRVSEITVNGIKLTSGTDFTANYKNCTASAIDDQGEILVTGKGSYKGKFKDAAVKIKVVQGKFHIKDGTVVDTAKIKNDTKKIVTVGKVTDAGGVKIKETDVTSVEVASTNDKITIVPSDTTNFKTTTLDCHVGAKLTSVAKQKKIVYEKAFDGVNTVTLTETEIVEKCIDNVEASDIKIVSYKNNHKVGAATVTIKARDNSAYYGTMNVKFKIVTNKPVLGEPTEPSTEEESGEYEKPSEAETGSETGSDVSSEPVGPDDPVTPPREKIIDVWDFGAKLETNTQMYKNHITADDWNNYADLGTDGKFTVGGDADFGDLSLNYLANDRIYSSTATKSAGSPSGVAAFKYSDGYTADGDYYCNGTGGESRRNQTIRNVLPGDRIDIYVGTSNATATDFHFDYLGNEGTQKEIGSIGTTNGKLSFVAKYSGSYKIWADGSGGKPITNRVKRVPAVDVAGTINLGPLASLEGITLKFVNETTKAETTATLDGTNFTVNLAAGYSYNAAITGIVGYGPTNESKKITLTDADALTGKSGVNLVMEEKETYVYSGTIKGFATDYDKKANLKVIMKTAPDVLNDDVELTITGLDSEAPQFKGTMEPDVEYTITLEGVNDYQVKGDAIVNQNKAYTADIEVELRPTYEAKGNFVDLDGNAVTGVTALTFKNVDDEYEYTATIAANGGSYTAKLRDGIYSAEATIEGYQTKEHVIVEGKEANKDILFVSTAEEGELTRKADLYVGYSDKGDANYETVSKAVKAAKRMNPVSEADRITIHIAPGVYREQIIVDVPYVSFVNDTPDKEVKLTWYQGIGYKYYSCVTGWYDEQDAHDRYKKGEPKNWGAAVQIKKTGFLAENIVFEHSLNRYITDEELADGVEPTETGGKPARDYTLDVKSKDATERGCAMFIDTGGNNAEFYRCKFLSSQDTIGTGKTGAHAYFKECFIEGNTDYICYDGDTIFDNCVLNFYGYSDRESGGYITAAQDSAANGYLFWNCTVTGNPNMKVAAGDFGRPWGQGAKVAFVNTKLERADIITGRGWTDMSGATAAKANFTEYNTTSLDGKTVDISKRLAGTVKNTNPIADVAAFEKYFGGWTPKHYVREDSTVAFETNPEITSNSDLNHPLPGNTLTVSYSLGETNNANDASVIKWYRVKDGTDPVLVKASTAQAGKTYKIQKTDVGFLIKVEVTPTVASGKSGTAASFQTEYTVSEGWEEPGQADAVLGDGINIFLAGDSTVKDYSAKGMYNGGTAQDLGSWGEFIQEYFNDEKVTIVNYAQGGRSTRNFMNEGKLDNIKKDIGEGDYLFIQFGHNDCAANYPDRFVPIGEPDAEGIYPTTAGTKGSDGLYAYDCGGTFKWFLKQYIQVAKDAGATPILVTPVARMYYTNGKIRPHHDCKIDSATPANTYASSNNAYVEAYKQVAEEENVILLDAFEITTKMYEDAYAAANAETYGKQIMGQDDATHCNKLGGFIEAGLIVNGIKELTDADGNNLDLDIVTAIKKPTQVLGKQVDNTPVFIVNANGELTAYNFLANPIYSTETEYWTTFGQELIDSMVAE